MLPLLRTKPLQPNLPVETSQAHPDIPAHGGKPTTVATISQMREQQVAQRL